MACSELEGLTNAPAIWTVLKEKLTSTNAPRDLLLMKKQLDAIGLILFRVVRMKYSDSSVQE